MMSMRAEELESMPESQAPLPPPEDQISSREAIQEFGVTQQQLASWRDRGRISWWKRGYWVVMSRRELGAFVASTQTLRPGRVLPTYEPGEPKAPDEPS